MRTHGFADHLGDMHLFGDGQIFAQPVDIRGDGRIDAHQGIHAGRPEMGALDKIVPPVADLHGAFGQCEGAAQARVSGPGFGHAAFYLGDRSHRPACLLVARMVEGAELTTLWRNMATSVKESLSVHVGALKTQRFSARQPMSLRKNAPFQLMRFTAS